MSSRADITFDVKKTSELSHLLKLATPVSLSMLTGLMMQLVDTLFVGPLGPTAIGGVSIGSAVFATFMVVGMGLSSGLDYLVAHAWGAKKLEACNQYLVQSLYIATMVSVVSMVIMALFSTELGRFGIVLDVSTEGGKYLRSVCMSLLPFLLFTAFRQYLQATGKAAPVLIILVVANLVNALCNWVFIYGRWGFPSLGVVGSGLATCVARVFMLFAIIAYAFWRDRRIGLGLWGTSLRFDRSRMVELVRLGLPSGLQLLFEVGVFATATLLAGRLGSVPLAAHQIVLQLASTTFMIPLGLSSASAVRVGQALGAGASERAARIGWTAFSIGASFAIVLAAVMLLTAGPLLGTFSQDPNVLAIGRVLLVFAAFFQLSDAVQVIGAGVLRGIGDTKVSMYTNFAGHWLVGLPAGYFFCFGLGWGVKGLWIGLSLGLTIVAAVLLYAWSRKVRRLWLNFEKI